MLAEIWSRSPAAGDFDPADPATFRHGAVAYAPADAEDFAEFCFHVADADWRTLCRFFADEPPSWDSDLRQTRYSFGPGAAAVLAAAEPYLKDEPGAG